MRLSNNYHKPLPSFSWANGNEVWDCMIEKDVTYSKLRSDKMLLRHPSLVDSYRTILYDWLSEVAHECKFHRETYHLAIDFTDRYLAVESNVSKLQLQLIGTTCLFVASKFEEIRPPTVIEFAELTDGACKAEDIINYEIVILSAIKWDITPMTPNNWLNMYMQILLTLDQDEEENNDEKCDDQQVKSRMQLQQQQQQQQLSLPQKQQHHQQPIDTNLATKNSKRNNKNPTLIPSPPVADENSQNSNTNFSSQSIATCMSKNSHRNDSFILPATNGIFRSNHKRIASVIDLALLHIGSLRYSNSILTASALYHFTDEGTVYQCTGFKYNQLSECVNWLRPFVETIKDIREPVFMASCRGELHSTQMHTHVATAKLLEKVVAKMEEQTILSQMANKRKACCMPDEDLFTDSDNESLNNHSPNKPTTLLTPPRSARKSRRVQ